MALGYRMVSFDFDELKIKTKQFGHEVDVENRDVVDFPQGLYLGSDQDFLDYYRDHPEPDEKRQDVRLVYEYDKSDLTMGDGSPDQELVVSKAKLVEAVFDDPEMQGKWGFLLNEDPNKSYKGRELGAEVDLGGQLGYVIRAQDTKMSHILHGDYCYLHSGFGTYRAGCEKILENIEDGYEMRNVHEKILKKGIEHAVTMAVTSGIEQQVILYPVKQGQVCEASNPGECLYNGAPNKKGRVLFTVSPDGVPSVPEPIRRKVEINNELSR